MTKSFLVSVGIFIGAGAMFAVMGVYEKLDDGISRTYRCAQLALEYDARRSAEKIIQHFLVELTLADLEAVTSAAGLQTVRFDELDGIEIYVGRSTVTAAVYVEATLDGKISAVSVPGSVSCEILEGGLEKE